jgi:Zn-dependent peptidase ImmA (M78 family)
VNEPKKPMAEANRISKILKLTLGEDRFPVNIEEVAKEISKKYYPDSPITKIDGKDLEGFDGLLKPNKDRSKWIIVYNTAVSPGRQRFTLAHEFGHYILHQDIQTEFACHQASSDDWDATERRIEPEADLFASTLLMPLDDFRTQVAGQEISFDLFGHCADRYGVSLTAAILRWLEITDKRAILVASRDDYLLWASSNRHAFRSRTYFATRKNTIPVPEGSNIHSLNRFSVNQYEVVKANIWFPEEPDSVRLTEMSLMSDQYDFTLTLLLMPKADWQLLNHDDEPDEEELTGFIGYRQFPG